MTIYTTTSPTEDPLEINASASGSGGGSGSSSGSSRDSQVFTFNDEDIEESTALTPGSRMRRMMSVPSTIQTNFASSSQSTPTMISPMLGGGYSTYSRSLNDMGMAAAATTTTPHTVSLEEDSIMNWKQRNKNTYNTPQKMETAPLSPTTFTIETSTKEVKYQNIRRFVKPILAAVTLATTGGAAYFFSGFFEVPGLKTQVGRLEEQNTLLRQQIFELEGQVDRLNNEILELGTEVDRLGNETGRLEYVTTQLNDTVVEYSIQNDQLNTSLDMYQQLNIELNTNTGVLKRAIDELEGTVSDYTQQNDQLNSTLSNLTIKIDTIEDINTILTEMNSALNIDVNVLSNETATLFSANDQLQNSVWTLTDDVDSLNTQNERLKKLTSNLGTVVSFINETSLEIDDSMDGFVQTVANSILTQRNLAMDSAKSLSLQKKSYWDCDFREHFLTYTFTTNRDLPITASYYDDVMEYIDFRILDELCLDVQDYERFLLDYLQRELEDDTIQLIQDVVSFHQIIRSVSKYADLANNYYFEDDDNSPLNASIWNDARFECKNLIPTLHYRYSK